jgi:hypothetical protein
MYAGRHRPTLSFTLSGCLRPTVQAPTSRDVSKTYPFANVLLRTSFRAGLLNIRTAILASRARVNLCPSICAQLLPSS